ncbi:DUF4175 family protein [Chryseolinea lacunae]|uniref:DUF4175 domain-containing protein n=1 Tax=Chryseolinea lacunae TaxID=2801331 RepID=A0ABS1KSU7_9BACT|nr:DUF4175 family protein [Chryseolinea lacunae]MBL0741772.1 hypothetical protein [Chryseolinea lacunae]
MGAGVERVHEKIGSFKKKYYLNIFVRGAILSLSILISYFLIAVLLEHNLWLGPVARFTIFLTFFGVVAFCLYRFLKEPLQWWFAKKGLSEEQSAKVIGQYIPTVKDRLLNLIQLSSSDKNSALAYASVEQKSKEFETVSFDSFIDLQQNKQYVKYLIVPIVVIVGIVFINRSILTQSANRIVHFTQEYSPQAPFKFLVEDASLNAFHNENLVLKLQLQGDALPESVYLLSGNQRLKLEHLATGDYTYTFDNVQNNFDLQFEAAGFFSDVFHVNVVSRPELSNFNVSLEFPRYLQRKGERLVNAGNLEVPEGTVVRWSLSTNNAEKAQMLFSSDKTPFDMEQSGNQMFSFGKEFRNPDQYEIILQNDKAKNKERIAYHVDVIKDEFPGIQVNNFRDSVLYKMVVLSGLVKDDYGVSQLALHFKIRNEDQKEMLSRTFNIPLAKNQLQQSFFHPWRLDSLELKPGSQLEYYLEVWDNDGVNGRKSTKTSRYTFLVPSEDNLVAEIKNSQSKTQQKIDQSAGKANKLHDKVEEANQKLKGKQNLDWQDKKMLEDIVEQKQSLEKQLDELKQQNELLEQKKDAFTKQDERIKEKAEQIQKLMNELLDDETKKLFEELQKLLKQNSDVSQIQKILDKLNQNTNNLEKELERTLELFKQLQYDYKLDQTAQDLKKQVEQQKELLEKTEALDKNQSSKSDKEQKSADGKKQDQKDQKQDSAKNQDAKNTDQKSDGNKESNDSKNDGDKNEQGKNQEGKNEKSQSLAKDQEKLKEDFKKTAEQIEELKKLGNELQKSEDLPSEKNSEEVEQDQEESQEQLEQDSPSKAKSPQQKALQKMQKMQQQMEGAQEGMAMEMDMQNIESLRQVIHGLVKLSFDEEGLMKSFAELNQNDPNFNTIAQKQLKLKDDAKVLEDSLLALGKRDPFMGSIVTKEVSDLNEHLDKVVEANRERRRPQASSEMQLTMTSINNLALMLDDHFDMMMQMMQNAKPSMGKSKKKGQKPSLSQMQQQLNQKIQELKGSGKSGRQLSEELAEMAAEQERIRKALQEMQEKMKDGKMPGGDLTSKMEQSEMDLVNKQLTDQLIKRQQDIVTRLLETEKSAREQDLDEERKGEAAKDYEKEIPKAFEDYLRLKEKEVELLKTVPPKLYPYYKKEVSEYFKRVGDK